MIAQQSTPMISVAIPKPISSQLLLKSKSMISQTTGQASSQQLHQVHSMNQSMPVLRSTSSLISTLTSLPTAPISPQNSIAYATLPTVQKSSSGSLNVNLDHIPLRYRMEYQKSQQAYLNAGKSRKTHPQQRGITDPQIYTDLQKKKMSTSLDKDYSMYKQIDSKIKQTFTPLICSLVKKKLASIDYFESKANKFQGNLNISQQRKDKRSSPNNNNPTNTPTRDATIKRESNRTSISSQISPSPHTFFTSSIGTEHARLPIDAFINCSKHTIQTEEPIDGSETRIGNLGENSSKKAQINNESTKISTSSLLDIPEDLLIKSSNESRDDNPTAVESAITFNLQKQSAFQQMTDDDDIDRRQTEIGWFNSPIQRRYSMNSMHVNSLRNTCNNMFKDDQDSNGKQKNAFYSQKSPIQQYLHFKSHRNTTQTDISHKYNSIQIKRVTFSERLTHRQLEDKSISSQYQTSPEKAITQQQYQTPLRRNKQSLSHHQFTSKSFASSVSGNNFDANATSPAVGASATTTTITTRTSTVNNSPSPPNSVSCNNSYIPRSLLMQAFPIRKQSAIISSNSNNLNYQSNQKLHQKNTRFTQIMSNNQLQRYGVTLHNPIENRNSRSNPREIASKSHFANCNHSTAASSTTITSFANSSSTGFLNQCLNNNNNNNNIKQQQVLNNLTRLPQTSSTITSVAGATSSSPNNKDINLIIQEIEKKTSSFNKRYFNSTMYRINKQQQTAAAATSGSTFEMNSRLTRSLDVKDSFINASLMLNNKRESIKSRSNSRQSVSRNSNRKDSQKYLCVSATRVPTDDLPF